MEILIADAIKPMHFSELKEGEVFTNGDISEENIYMKTEYRNNIHAVNLLTGTFTTFYDIDPVIKLRGTLTVNKMQENFAKGKK